MLVLTTATSFEPAALPAAGVLSIFFSSVADAPPRAKPRATAAVRSAVQVRTAVRAARARYGTSVIGPSSVERAGILPEGPPRGTRRVLRYTAGDTRSRVHVWSHSRLSSFEKCPLQYRYRYIDRIKRDVQGIEGFMGRRVHEALEHLYREVGRGRVPGAGEVVEVYRTRWAAEYDPARVRIVRREFHAEDYRATGELCLRDFHAAHAPFADGETLGIEEEVQFALDPAGRYAI